MNSGNLVKVIEKRARKKLSKSGITRNSIVAVVNDGSCEGEVNSYLARRLVNATDKIKFLKSIPRNSSGYDFILLPDTADKEAERFLEFMLNSSPAKELKRAVKLLNSSLGSEVAAYAKIKRIKYAGKNHMSDVALLLERLERNKGTKFALAKISEKVK